MGGDLLRRLGAPEHGIRGEHAGALGLGEDLGRLGGLAAVHADQVGAHLRRGLVAVVRVLGQRLEHHGVEFGGDALVALRRRDGILADVLVGHGDGGVADERWLPSEDFVQHATQRVDVGAGVDGFAARLLRRQVLGGADHRGGLGDAVARVGERAGDAEVHHLHGAGLADHDVRGLDVAVDDAVLVAEVQRLAGVGDDLDGLPGWDRSVAVHDVAQRHAVDVLHHDVGQRAGRRLGLPGVVDRHDRGVVQCRGVLRLASEAQVEAGVAGEVGAQHLDGDVAVQADVAGEVDLGHASEAQNLADLVAIGQLLRGGHPKVRGGSGL